MCERSIADLKAALAQASRHKPQLRCRRLLCHVSVVRARYQGTRQRSTIIWARACGHLQTGSCASWPFQASHTPTSASINWPERQHHLLTMGARPAAVMLRPYQCMTKRFRLQRVTVPIIFMSEQASSVGIVAAGLCERFLSFVVLHSLK